METKPKYSQIKLFKHFTDSLSQITTTESIILSWPKVKTIFCHRLAVLLQQKMPELYSDLCPPKSFCDVVVHDRNTPDYQALSIFFKTDYLTQKEQKQLLALSESTDGLVLGLSYFAKKSYFLIYYASNNQIEYYHFDKSKLECEKLKSRNLTTKKIKEIQLTLDLKMSRSK